MTTIELSAVDGSAVLVTHALLLAFVFAAAGFDLKSRRIPNWLVLAGLIVSLICGLIPGGGTVSAWGEGLTIGFALFIPFYIFRAMGAGDVKLMAMVGSFLGVHATLDAVLFTFAAGGCVALLYALLNGRARALFVNLRFMVTDFAVKLATGGAQRIEAPAQSAGHMPFGVAIAAGTLVSVLLAHSGHMETIR